MLKYFSIFLMCYVIASAFRSTDTEKLTRNNLKVNKLEYKNNYDSLYSSVIEHLKEFEGFSSKVYIDVDGSSTIGYGHHLLANENYTTITENQAENLLKHDLDIRISYVKQNYQLNKYKTLALGLFAYNVGTGNLNKAVKHNNLLSDIDNILSYCHYRTKKEGVEVLVKSDKLLRRRQFELKLYKYTPIKN